MSASAQTKQGPKIPHGKRLYAIGDIHGESATLRDLLKKIYDDAAAAPAESYALVFVGDYIDRGIDSKGVIDILTKEIPPLFERVFIRGNHDDSLLRMLKGDTSVVEGWLAHGAKATFASYGVNPFRINVSFDQLQEELRQALPDEHLAFFESTVYDYSCGDYFFVHAGIRPGVALDQQTTVDKLWMREPFLSSKRDHGKIIIHGHTIAQAPQVFPNRIGIDTGAYAHGNLTCLVLQDHTHYFLHK